MCNHYHYNNYLNSHLYQSIVFKNCRVYNYVHTILIFLQGMNNDENNDNGNNILTNDDNNDGKNLMPNSGKNMMT